MKTIVIALALFVTAEVFADCESQYNKLMDSLHYQIQVNGKLQSPLSDAPKAIIAVGEKMQKESQKPIGDNGWKFENAGKEFRDETVFVKNSMELSVKEVKSSLLDYEACREALPCEAEYKSFKDILFKSWKIAQDSLKFATATSEFMVKTGKELHSRRNEIIGNIGDELVKIGETFRKKSVSQGMGLALSGTDMSFEMIKYERCLAQK